MHNFNLLSHDDISKDRKEGKYCRKSSLSIYGQKRHMIDFEAIRQVADAGSSFVSVSYDNNFVASVDKLGRELVKVTFYSSRLREEVVTDHGNSVRHVGRRDPYLTITRSSNSRAIVRGIELCRDCEIADASFISGTAELRY